MIYEKLYLNGEWVKPHLDAFIEVENPATRQVIGKVPRGDAYDVDQAVQAAEEAFETWSDLPLKSRMGYLVKVLEYLKTHKERLIKTEVQELGAPKKWAERAHVNGPITRFENYLTLIETFEFVEALTYSKVIKEPIGVVACITPWNYPLGQVMQKIVPALLCGNTVVLKPSQVTPLSAFILAEGFAEAEVPKGVFNLVSGKGGEVGNAMAEHPKVQMVSFTGSTTGGREVGKLAVAGIKKIALELGGKSANIVLKGADLELAVRVGLSSCFDNTGQTCAALTRMLVPKSDLKEIEALVIEGAKRFVVGDPEDEHTNVGPLASRKQFDKVKRYIEHGIEEGATLLLGEVPKDCEHGYYVNPCVFTNVSNTMTIAQEEIFGPVMCLIPYEDIEEAIAIANDSIYGLSGAVFGPDEEAKKVARKIKTGSIYVNDALRDIHAPFGGYKQSGIGREGGPYGIEEFLETKAIFE